MNSKHLTIFMVVVTLLSVGCLNDSPGDKDERVARIPETADVLLLSNRDTGGRLKEIYAMDTVHGTLTRITYSSVHHFMAGVDPSGRYIAATRMVEDTAPPQGLGDEDERSLWVIDTHTGEERRLSPEGAVAEGKSFSPDSEWIVFWMIPQGRQTSDIYKVRRDGTELTQLTNTPARNEWDPEWSRDGQRIVFNRYDQTLGRTLLKSMDTDGNHVRLVHDGGPGVSTPLFPPGNYDPSWSPDGDYVLFDRAVSYQGEGENWGAGIWRIFRVRVDGTELTDLSVHNQQADAANYLPSYSPDGTLIIFSSRYEHEGSLRVDVFTMGPQGGSLVRLTDSRNSVYYDMGAWIP